MNTINQEKVKQNENVKLDQELSQYKEDQYNYDKEIRKEKLENELLNTKQKQLTEDNSIFKQLQSDIKRRQFQSELHLKYYNQNLQNITQGQIPQGQMTSINPPQVQNPPQGPMQIQIPNLDQSQTINKPKRKEQTIDFFDRVSSDWEDSK